MKIDYISARAFKGWTGRQDLAPVTHIYGPNFAGKSARVESLVLALAGYLPGIGKRPSDLFARLASGSSMAVMAKPRDRAVVTREWTANGDSVKATASGETLLEPVQVDAMEFLSLSAAERVKFLFRMANLGPEWEVGKVRDSIVANLKNHKLDEHTAQTEAGLRAVVDVVGELPTDSVKESPGMTQSWLESLSAKGRDFRNATDQSVRRMQSTVAGLAQVAVGDPVAPDAEGRWTRCGQELEDLRRQAFAAKAQAEQAERAVGEAKVAKAKLDAAPELTSLKEQAAELNDWLGKHEPKPIQSVKQLHEKAYKDSRRLASDVAMALQRGTELEQELKLLNAAKECPTCGQKVRKSHKADSVAKLTSDITLAKGVHAKAKSALAPIAKLEEQLSKELAELENVTRLYNEKGSTHRSLLNRITTLERGQNPALAARLPELEAIHVEAKAAYDRLVPAAQAKKAEHAALEADMAKLRDQRATAANRERVLAEADKAKAELAYAKALVAIVGEVQSQLVRTAVGPVLDRANELCGGILPFSLGWNGEDIVACSVTNPMQSSYPWRSFSGTEKALACCALSLALAVDAPFRLVVLDELGRLDHMNRVRFVHRLCDLVAAGKLDQAVVVSTEPLEDNTSLRGPKETGLLAEVEVKP